MGETETVWDNTVGALKRKITHKANKTGDGVVTTEALRPNYCTEQSGGMLSQRQWASNKCITVNHTTLKAFIPQKIQAHCDTSCCAVIYVRLQENIPNRHKVPDHHEHPWVCSWRHQCPCWPDQMRPPWRPALRISYDPGRSPVNKDLYIINYLCIINGIHGCSLSGSFRAESWRRLNNRLWAEKVKQIQFDNVSAPTSTVKWAMMALWCPSSVSSAITAISASDLPINIWQAVANISLFWPWIFTWRRTGKEKCEWKWVAGWTEQ